MTQLKITEGDNRLSWFGDKMTFTESWPNTNERNSIQFFTINHNGITSYNYYLEWELTIAMLADMQVNVYGITEPSLDFNNGSVRESFTKKGRYFDKYMRMSLSSSKQTISKSPFKMGEQ